MKVKINVPSEGKNASIIAGFNWAGERTIGCPSKKKMSGGRKLF